MPNGYKSQPISGFTGYIPGAKWQVGSRYVPQQKMESENAYSISKDDQLPQQQQNRNQKEGKMSNERSEMRNFAEMSNEELQEKLTRMQMDMQNIQAALSMNQGEELEGYGDGESGSYREKNDRSNRRTEYESRQNLQQENSTVKQRSKSVPRKIENNPFDGIESGWWSKGEVKRNKERREIANGGQMVSGGNWNQRPPSRQRLSRTIGAVEKDTSEDIPAAGYSGHIQGMRHLGVGKPFNVAAKQAKREYIERRRTYSGSRDILNNRPRVQYSDEEVLTNTVKLPDNRF